MPRSPFGDYAQVDLSSIYGAPGGPSTVTGGGTPGTPGAGTPGAGTPGVPSPRVTDTGTDQTGTAGDPGYIDPQAPGGSFAKGSPQGQALSNPTQPYLDTSVSGGVSYTPDQARQWWNQWFANPVNLLTVPPELLPGTLVLSPDEIERARALGSTGTLPPAPANYNPMNLAVAPGAGGASYGASGGFGGYGTAQNALSAAMDHGVRGSGQPAEQTYQNTLGQVGGYTPNYYPAGAPGGSTGGTGAPVDYAALAATDRRYAASLAKTDKNKSEMYLARAIEYEGRATAAPAAAPAAQPAAPAPTAAAPAPGGINYSAAAAQLQQPIAGTQAAWSPTAPPAQTPVAPVPQAITPKPAAITQPVQDQSAAATFARLGVTAPR